MLIKEHRLLIWSASVRIDSRRINQSTIIRLAGLSIGIGQIKPVGGTATSVTRTRNALLIAHGLVAIRDIRLACDHDIRSLDERSGHACFNVEFGVAMEEPDTRVVGDEADGDAHAGIHDHGVTSHGCCGSGVETGPHGLVACAVDDLELMAMEMEGVGAGVVVVEVDFNDLAVLKNLWVDLAVYLRILLICRGCCQGAEERWDLRMK